MSDLTKFEVLFQPETFNIKAKRLINVLINLVEAETSLNFYNFLPVLATENGACVRQTLPLQKNRAIEIFFTSKIRRRKENRESMNNNSNLSVRHEIALINGVATRIASARSIEENICIVVIPGNPGGIGFYDIFISTIFQAGKGKYSVYGVSHAGKVKINFEKITRRMKISRVEFFLLKRHKVLNRNASLNCCDLRCFFF